MSLNHEKTYVVTYTRKVLWTRFSYHIGGNKIARKEEITDLGVIFDSKLLFKSHIKAITSKARRSLGLVLWVGRDFSSTTVVHLFKSIVRPVLEYCSVVWNLARGYTDDMLEAVQGRLLSALRHRSYQDVDCDTLCTAYRLQSLKSRRLCQDVLLVHKIIHGDLDLDSSEVYYRIPHASFRSFRLLACKRKSVISPLARCIEQVNSNECLDIFRHREGRKVSKSILGSGAV